MIRFAARAHLLLMGAALAVVSTGCAASAPEPESAQPDVDAAIVATLPDDFSSAFTELDDESKECLTTVTLLPDRYGLSAAMLSDTIDLIRTGGDKLKCVPVLHVVDSEGEQKDIEHVAKYLPVQARDGDLVVR